MYKVKAKYQFGQEHTFYSDAFSPKIGHKLDADADLKLELSRRAKLVHLSQREPTSLEYEKVVFDASYHFYSVSFRYSCPDNARPSGFLGGGVHVSFSYDEEEASRRLIRATYTLDLAAQRAGLMFKHEYSYPDGSLYLVFASQKPKEEFEAIDLKENLEREITYLSEHPFSLPRTYKEGKKTRTYKEEFGESRVSPEYGNKIRERRPWYGDPHKTGCLNTLDYFNGIRYESWQYPSPHVKDVFTVSDKLADSFELGFTEGFGHSTYFVEHLDRHAEEEISTFGAAYHLAKILQVLTFSSVGK